MNHLDLMGEPSWFGPIDAYILAMRGSCLWQSATTTFQLLMFVFKIYLSLLRSCNVRNNGRSQKGATRHYFACRVLARCMAAAGVSREASSAARLDQRT
jgi:hypothetical protein